VDFVSFKMIFATMLVIYRPTTFEILIYQNCVKLQTTFRGDLRVPRVVYILYGEKTEHAYDHVCLYNWLGGDE
jgi:hypothetical protein